MFNIQFFWPDIMQIFFPTSRDIRTILLRFLW
jgi:hypothetical protein